MTDNRLLDCDTKAEIEADMIRLLALIDALTERVKALENPAETKSEVV